MSTVGALGKGVLPAAVGAAAEPAAQADDGKDQAEAFRKQLAYALQSLAGDSLFEMHEQVTAALEEDNE